MGVITNIASDNIASALKAGYNIKALLIQPTKEGITDTVYKIIDKEETTYLLKIYESVDENIVQEEIQLVNELYKNGFPVPSVYPVTTKQFCHQVGIDERPACLFRFLSGESPVIIKPHHIKEIARFLADFHTYTDGRNDYISNNYTTDQIKYNLAFSDQSDTNTYDEIFDSIDDQEEHGIIHGDLFPDNVFFQNDRLSGVFDFAASCRGSFQFDLAVVAVSWCFTDDRFDNSLFELLIDSYSQRFQSVEIIEKQLFNWMKFACLYYASQRLFMQKINRDSSINHRPAEEYFKKLERLSDSY